MSTMTHTTTTRRIARAEWTKLRTLGARPHVTARR